MKRKLFLIVLLLAGLKVTTKAQSYNTAIGGRLGFANGISFKTFVNRNNALDFILNFRDKDNYSTFRLTGLYEVHVPINNAPGLRWYYGGGATIGSRKFRPTNDSRVVFAIDGVLGLDYKFTGAPINIALDWKPAVEIAPNTEFDAEGLGLSLRFAF